MTTNSAAIARARLNTLIDRRNALENSRSYENLSHENKQKALTYMIEGGIENMQKLIDLYELSRNA